MAFAGVTLKIYVIISALMFVGGAIAGAALAMAGYDLPTLF